MLSFDAIEFEDIELKEMNHKKERHHQFVYFETFMES